MRTWSLALLVISAGACRCRDVPLQQVQVARWSADRFEVVSVSLIDGQVKVLFERGRGPVSGSLPFEAALNSERDLLAVQETDGPIEIVRLGKGTKVELRGTKGCMQPVFLRGRPWLMCTRTLVDEEEFQIEVYDFEKQALIKTLEGAAPIQAVSDDSVLFNHDEEIFSYQPATNLARVAKTVALKEGDVGVAEVIPVSAQKFFYLLGQSGSTVYVDESDAALLPWDRTRNPERLWQGELHVDPTGKRLVFEEHGGPETSLVIVDLSTRKTQRFAVAPDVSPHVVAFDQERIVYMNEGPDKSRLFVLSITANRTQELLEFKGLMRGLR